jgi:hypothetical protein
VAARGDPEQVYATDETQHRRNRTLARGALGLVALLLAAVAGFHFYTLYHPLEGYDLPHDVAMGVGTGSAVLALLVVAAAVVCTGTAWGDALWGPRAYLIYEDVLVELCGARHRVIPWEAVGEGRFNRLTGQYRFAVTGGGALTFDETVRDHEALVDTIKESAAGRRNRLAFRDRAVLDEMSAAQVGPVVTARDLGSPGEGYRITLLGDALLFYPRGWSDPSDERPPTPIWTAGLAGALISGFNAWAYSHARQKGLEELRRLERADAATLVRLAQQTLGSFVATRADVRAIRLDPLARGSALLSALSGSEPACVLALEHARQGSLSLALLSRDDVLKVVGEWAKLFGDVIEVNIAWSHSKCGFIPKP